MKELYKDLNARIITEVEGQYLEIKRGVRQGDHLLSPILFDSMLEEIFRNLDWRDRGINVNGVKITNLRFADDVLIIAKSQNELEEQSRKGGLGMNIYKTKIINKQEDKNEVKMKTFKIETCTMAMYLGQQISLEDKMEHEINIRISKAWAKFWSLKDIFKGNFNNQHKSQVFNIPCMTYGC